MTKREFRELFAGSDLRSLGSSGKIISQITSNESFDELFELLLDFDRAIAMKSIDVVEKITKTHPEFLEKHKSTILNLITANKNIEFKWHLALLVVRLPLNNLEFDSVWQILCNWFCNSKESKIVRVNALQGLFDLSKSHPDKLTELKKYTSKISLENVASLNARIRKLKL